EGADTGIDLMDGSAERRQDGFWVAGGTNDESIEGVWILIVGFVFGGPDRLVERALADVVDDADDLFDGVGSEGAVAVFLADRVFAGKVFIGEGLVDDRDSWSSGVILLGQETASQ